MTEVAGVAMLIGIVVIGIAVVLLFGGTALTESQNAAELGQANHALVQLDTEASGVALGESPVGQVDLGIGMGRGGLTADPDRGHITVEYTNQSTIETTEVLNTSLGAVVYEQGDTTLGYQGGGVWRSDGDQSTMVSRPEFHFRNTTLTMPIIRTDGGSVHSDVQVTRLGQGDPRFPDESINLTNKVHNAEVVITIQSEYYLAWGRYFEEDVNTIVGYDHAANTVIVRFIALPKTFTAHAGVIATAGPGEIDLAGTGAYIDSYNSSNGPYDATSSTDGEVEAAGDVILSGDSEIAGNVRSGGTVGIDNNKAVINGNVSYTDSFEDPKGQFDYDTYNVTEINGIQSLPPIDGLVEERVNEVSADNDNDQTNTIQNDELNFAGGSGELGPGSYYLETAHIEGETLVLNATDGDIQIAVRDWVKLEKSGGTGGEIVVEGDGNVRFIVAAEQTVEANPTGGGHVPVDEFHLFVGTNSEIDVGPDQRSRQFIVWGPRHFVGAVAGSGSSPGTFDGIIYAPAGEFGSGQVYMMQSHLYGSVVTGNLTLGNKGQVHFDRSLTDLEFPLAPTIPRLEYLYATLYDIEVEQR